MTLSVISLIYSAAALYRSSPSLSSTHFYEVYFWPRFLFLDSGYFGCGEGVGVDFGAGVGSDLGVDLLFEINLLSTF